MSKNDALTFSRPEAELPESVIYFCSQPGPDSVGIFAISQSCSGVAARACGLVSLEPTKVSLTVSIK